LACTSSSVAVTIITTLKYKPVDIQTDSGCLHVK
jgi:hypothetical protein